MKLRVQYTAQLRAAVGRTEEDVDLPESSNVAELLVHLATHRGRDAKPHLITDDGQAQPSLLLVVNGSAVPAREATMTMLKPGDVVTLLPPIAGG